MIIFTNNVAVGPAVILASMTDLYLAAILIRCILVFRETGPAVRARQALQPVTDLIPNAIRRRLNAGRERPVPGWLPWAITIASVVVVQDLLLWVAVANS